jgi:hypothetical protein
MQKRLRYRDLEELGIVKNRPHSWELDSGSRLPTRPIDRAELAHLERRRGAGLARQPADLPEGHAAVAWPPRAPAQDRAPRHHLISRTPPR